MHSRSFAQTIRQAKQRHEEKLISFASVMAECPGVLYVVYVG